MLLDPRLHLGLLLVLLMPADEPSIVLRDDVDHSESIAAAREYPGLAHLDFITPRGFREGEATLIDPVWLLTAAHVTGRLVPGHEISVGDETVPVAEVVPHPDWTGGPGGGPDIALVRLRTPIRGVAPVPLYRDRDETGRPIVLVGLGDFGTGLTGAVDNDGEVRLATNIVDSVDPDWIIFDFDPPSSSEATPFEGVAGPGDSGGPAFIEVDGVPHVAGVSSRQSRGSASGPGRSGGAGPP